MRTCMPACIYTWVCVRVLRPVLLNCSSPGYWQSGCNDSCSLAVCSSEGAPAAIPWTPGAGHCHHSSTWTAHIRLLGWVGTHTSFNSTGAYDIYVYICIKAHKGYATMHAFYTSCMTLCVHACSIMKRNTHITCQCCWLAVFSCVRVWRGEGAESLTIKAHSPAVWTVAGLFKHDGSRRFISGKSSLMHL